MKIRVERKGSGFRIPKDLAPFFNQAKDYGISSTIRKINRGINPPNAPLTQAVKKGNKTLRDRGLLMGSITGKSDNRSAEVGTNYGPARILHEGGTIKAKKSYLYIPAGAKTRSLMRSYGSTPGSCISAMKSKGYTIWRQGRTVMARKRGGKKAGDPFVLFFLKKEVKIPARPFLYIDKTDRKIFFRMFRDFVTGRMKNE